MAQIYMMQQALYLAGVKNGMVIGCLFDWDFLNNSTESSKLDGKKK